MWRASSWGQAYATSARLNGKPSVGWACSSPTGNALAAAKAVREKMTELERFFPQGMKWSIPYDSSRFVEISIKRWQKPWWRRWRWCFW